MDKSRGNILFYVVLNFGCLFLFAKSQILIVYDESLNFDVENEVKSAVPENISVSVSFLKGTDNYIDNLERLDVAVGSTSAKYVIAFAALPTLNAAISVTDGTQNIMSVIYSTSSTGVMVSSASVFTVSPSHYRLGKSVVSLIGRELMDEVFVICQDWLQTDGFMDAFLEPSRNLQFNRSHVLFVSASEPNTTIQLKLHFPHEAGFRLFVLHATTNFARRILELAGTLGYLNTGYAWVLTELAMPTEETDLREYPLGLLFIERYEVDSYKRIMLAMVKAVLDLAANKTDSVNSLESLPEMDKLMQDEFTNMSKRECLFDESGHRTSVNYRIRNLVHNEELNQTCLKTIGQIQDDHLEMDAVVWPGETIFGPILKAREHFTVVTRAAPPFVFISEELSEYDYCALYHVCIQVYTYDSVEIKTAISKFRSTGRQHGENYTTHCCDGIVIDLLKMLSSDLRFDFTLYFKNDTNYGRLEDGVWTGMVGDLQTRAADIIAGAFSVTSDRMAAIKYTDPFYVSGFNMVSKEIKTASSSLAFLHPFDTALWCSILGAATITAIITSMFEWRSPFGLNPWARKRASNYTLGSGLTMVYSVWFGHTVKTKTPKSWPSKFLQNVWAGMAIFLTASYTANLAAYLAGGQPQHGPFNILDSELLQKRIAVLDTSAVEEYAGKVNERLRDQQKYHVKSLEDAFQKLRNGEIDLYLDDLPILEYGLSQMDTNCSIQIAGHTFSDDTYAFGLRKNSWLEVLEKRLSPLILQYVEMGLVNDMKYRYLGKSRQCKETMSSANVIRYSWEQTAGLFYMLLIAIGLSLMTLAAEHVFYMQMLPWLRRKPKQSVWKNRNVEYFSQRLYRSIVCEKLIPPRQSAKELVQIVKGRNFAHIFQKNELRNKSKSVSNPGADKNKFVHLADNMITIQRLQKESSERTENGNIFAISNKAFQMECDTSDSECSDCSCPRTTRIGSICFQLEHENRCGEDSVDRRTEHEAKSTDRDTPVFENSDIDLPITERTCKCESHRKLNTRYGTWPSPKTRKRSVKLKYSEETKGQHRSYSDADNVESYSIFGVASAAASTSVKHRPLRQHSELIKSNNYYDKSVRLKDNRVKSTIRRHAMANYHRQSSVAFDDCAVEALTKEDLLVMWKRSEIELQTKLNRIHSQNQHLRHLINVVEKEEERQRDDPVASHSDMELICTRL